MRVCFVGSNWAPYLARLVNTYTEGGIHADALDLTKHPPIGLNACLLSSDIWVRVGVRPGSPRYKLFAFDLYWWLIHKKKPEARVVYYWIGTDVIRAVDDFMHSRMTPFFRESLRHMHLAGAPWLVRELEDIGIHAKDVLFPADLPISAPIFRLPDKFTITSYIPDSRSEFYGGHVVYEMARRFPDVQFKIFGGKGTWVGRHLPNLSFLGWVDNMADVYRHSSVVLRMVKHDALGATVMEALAMARHVIYNYPVPHTIQVAFGDVSSLTVAINELHKRHQNGKLGPNIKGREYALDAWEPRKLTRALIDVLIGIPN